MNKPKYIVISGCSGGGKSTLLAKLQQQGYCVVPEVGREIVHEQQAQNGTKLPWRDALGFCELLINKSIAVYHKATQIGLAKDKYVFFDRSLLEGVSYYQTLAAANPQQYDNWVYESRYDPLVFMAPPWQEIFCEDAERKHPFTQAVEEYQRLQVYYAHHGYQLVSLPKVTVDERYQFIVDTLAQR